MAHKKLSHAMTNIGAMKICGTLLSNGMPCHYHMEDQFIINCKGQQYFELANE
jgi:hypothetical protein